MNRPPFVAAGINENPAHRPELPEPLRPYLVTWTIDVDADSPRAAAEAARAYQAAGTTALVFHVTEPDGEIHTIDLEETHDA